VCYSSCGFSHLRKRIHDYSRFSIRESWGESIPRKSRNTSWSTAISASSSGSTPKMGPTKVRDVVMPPGPWSITGLLPVGLVSRTCLGNLYWDIVDKRPNQRSWDFDSERSVPRFRTLRLSQLGTLLRGVTQWTLRKNSISGACTGIVLFCVYLLLLPNNHNHSYGSEQRHVWKLRALRCLKTPVLLPQSTKAHAELRLLYQSVYQSPCWPSVTREYQLKAGAQPWVRGICGVCLP